MEDEQNIIDYCQAINENDFPNEEMICGETILPKQLSTADQIHNWIMNLND